ncbi:unnamed protein product [Taenia asiatica]|uniref:Uncharacterized protein n=1 Tax=Taenia asiatica TaxID=60517 RepID=A0A0R3WDH8_TAEAS|nr:unnamed protein product [Taenia asiatica]
MTYVAELSVLIILVFVGIFIIFDLLYFAFFIKPPFTIFSFVLIITFFVFLVCFVSIVPRFILIFIHALHAAACIYLTKFNNRTQNTIAISILHFSIIVHFSYFSFLFSFSILTFLVIIFFIAIIMLCSIAIISFFIFCLTRNPATVTQVVLPLKPLDEWRAVNFLLAPSEPIAIRGGKINHTRVPKRSVALAAPLLTSSLQLSEAPGRHGEDGSSVRFLRRNPVPSRDVDVVDARKY